jgi:hypothetical protein
MAAGQKTGWFCDQADNRLRSDIILLSRKRWPIKLTCRVDQVAFSSTSAGVADCPNGGPSETLL